MRVCARARPCARARGICRAERTAVCSGVLREVGEGLVRAQRLPRRDRVLLRQRGAGPACPVRSAHDSSALRSKRKAPTAAKAAKAAAVRADAEREQRLRGRRITSSAWRTSASTRARTRARTHTRNHVRMRARDHVRPRAHHRGVAVAHHVEHRGELMALRAGRAVRKPVQHRAVVLVPAATAQAGEWRRPIQPQRVPRLVRRARSRCRCAQRRARSRCRCAQRRARSRRRCGQTGRTRRSARAAGRPLSAATRTALAATRSGDRRARARTRTRTRARTACKHARLVGSAPDLVEEGLDV